MVIKPRKKAWSVTAHYPYHVVTTVVYAPTLQRAFWRFARQWHMEDVFEISITEVTSDERSEGISGAHPAD